MAKYKTVVLDRNVLVLAVENCVDRVKYKYGAKPNLRVSPARMGQSDCSGFVRWLLYQASENPRLNIPHGSANQRHWCENQGFKETSYKENAHWKDGRVRIAFINRVGSAYGHVWLVLDGKTLECYGGVGVGRRAWNSSKLLNYVHHCYVLTGPLA